MVHWKYYPQAEARDLRLDFLRGYFVFVMTINHLNMFPAWTSVLTGANRLWVSAAIGFVLISGFVFGTIYRVRIATKGWHWSIEQVSHRAIQLYLLSALSRLILATGDYVLRLFWERSSPLPENYWHIVEGALLHTRYWFTYTDILALYAFLLPLGLIAIYFLDGSKWQIALFGSFLLWYASQINASTLHFLHIGFHLFIWQFPFIISIIIGYYRQEISAWWAKRPFPKLSTTLLTIFPIILLVLNYLIVFQGLWPGVDWEQINSSLFDKYTVAPGRLIFALWLFASAYELLTRFWHVLQRLLGWLFLPLGQNALVAYLIQGLVSYLVSRCPGYPFTNHDPVIMGFLHLIVVMFVWQATKLIVGVLENPWQRWEKSLIMLPKG